MFNILTCYTLDSDKWATLLEVGPSAQQMPSFVSWVHLFPASLAIITWLDDEAASEDSEYLISSRAPSLMQHVTRRPGHSRRGCLTEAPGPWNGVPVDLRRSR